jgi:hypothetical protein
MRTGITVEVTPADHQRLAAIVADGSFPGGSCSSSPKPPLPRGV